MTIAFLAKSPFHAERVRGESEGGLYNGYVAFDKDLPLSYQGGASWDNDDALDNKVSIHGGITYDQLYEDNWLDMIPLTSIPDLKTLDSYRVVGFDTSHYGDTKERWDFEAVKEETLRLLEQIEAL